VEPLFVLIVAATAASIAYLVASERRRAHLRIWDAAAQRVGLTEVEESEGGIFEGGFLLGRCGDLRARLEGYRRGKYENGTKIVVTGLGGAGKLSLCREGLSTAFGASSASGRSRSATRPSTRNTTCRARPRSPSRSSTPRRGGAWRS
jgi:hypothetical protein